MHDLVVCTCIVDLAEIAALEQSPLEAPVHEWLAIGGAQLQVTILERENKVPLVQQNWICHLVLSVGLYHIWTLQILPQPAIRIQLAQ